MNLGLDHRATTRLDSTNHNGQTETHCPTKMNMLRTFTLPTLLLLCFAGCERKANVSSPSHYEKNGVKFSYPGNWEVTEDSGGAGFRSLFVESPGDAILIAQIYSKNDGMSLDEFSRAFSKSAAENTPVASVGPGTYSEIDPVGAGSESGVKETLVISLLGEKIPHVREYHRIEFGDRVAFLVSQSATEDLKKVGIGFDMVFETFKIE